MVRLKGAAMLQPTVRRRNSFNSTMVRLKEAMRHIFKSVEDKVSIPQWFD